MKQTIGVRKTCKEAEPQQTRCGSEITSAQSPSLGALSQTLSTGKRRILAIYFREVCPVQERLIIVKK